MYARLLKPQDKAFFLFGPRGVGKSTWLKQQFGDAYFVDLLTANTSLKYARDPSLLAAEVRAQPKNRWIVIDEIQKVPALLDEVHGLMENDGHKKFALSGSSARKLKRGAANMLAGRANTKALYPLTLAEVDFQVRPEEVLEYGLLPLSVGASRNYDKEDFLKSYVTIYLSEEIKAEGLVRDIGHFSRFLSLASLVAGTQVNISALARDAGIGRDTVEGYFSIFEDTLLGSFLPAYRPRAKVKEVSKPKFYWFDSGVLHAAAGGFDAQMPKDWRGVLMEHWIYHELRAYLDYNRVRGQLGFWRTPSGTEVDFLWWYGNRAIAIEVKSSESFRREFLKGIYSLGASMDVEASYLVYLGKDRLLVENVNVVPVTDFLRDLSEGRVI
ncbi:MAG: ATP-binding protein [Deltaproteobacteria bacterium]|nr:ATP-binding protein [Deltaproteobacteria bacterium]